jgi:hypothetical protein
MGMESVIAYAKEHLARRNGITSESLSLKKVEPITWPDASLGSPRSGKLYAQIATPGYRLVLSYSSSCFEYHTDTVKRVVLHREVDQGEKMFVGGGL